MNPNLKDLRVAVVPTETGNSISQRSSVEEILACDEVVLMSVSDYFKAQNDEELPTMHWSFLIDIEKNNDLTGMNIDGIHMHTKTTNISIIKKILSEWGFTSVSELELESSPTFSSIGNVCQLVEEFTEDYARVITYQGGRILDEIDVTYEELSDDIIVEIRDIVERYDAEQQKLHDSCRDEDF